MTVLPIVERELRVMSRRPRSHSLRWVIVTAVILGAVINMFYHRMEFGDLSGGEMFRVLAVLLAGLAVLSAFTGADSISQEKRNDTLGLLFLTDLNGWDVILGKLVTSALPAFYIVLGALPIISLTLLIGGVAVAQYIKTSLALLNLLFLSHAIAIFGSAVFRKKEDAVGFPVLCAIGYLTCMFIADAAAEKGQGTIAMLFQIINPIWTLFEGLKAQTAPEFLSSLVAVHTTAWLLLILSSLLLPHLWRHAPETPAFWRRCWEHICFGDARRQAALRRRLIGQNPVLWLISRRKLGPISVWLAMAFGLASSLVCVFAAMNGSARWVNMQDAIYFCLIIVPQVVLRLSAAGLIGGSLEEQRRSGNLELVLYATPLTVTDVIRAQWMAWRRWLHWLALVEIGFSLALAGSIICVNLHYGHADANSDLVVVWFILVLNVLLLPDMWASSWMAMWAAMASKKCKRYLARGAALGVMIPHGFFFALMSFTDVGYDLDPLVGLLLWFITVLACDLALAWVAQWWLKDNFRHRAMISSQYK